MGSDSGLQWLYVVKVKGSSEETGYAEWMTLVDQLM